MTDNTQNDWTRSAPTRVVTAMFDTDGAARKAVDDLIEAGVPREHITRTDGQTAGEPVTKRAPAGEDQGFWESLKQMFLPDEDRHAYAEGLDRGGYLITVRTDEARYNRAIDILDTDGAMDLDEREESWRSEGWTGYAGAGPRNDAMASAAAGMPGGRTSPVGTAGDSVAGGASDRSATPVGTAPGTGQGFASGQTLPLVEDRLAVRDLSHGRTRLRSYTVESPVAGDGAGSATATPFTSHYAARIVEHMDVISADGEKIGTVDHLDGPDRIKLAKNTSPDGQHHYVPFTWIDHVDQHVHLKRTLADIKAETART